MIHDHSRDGTGPAIASCTRQRGYLSPILCLFRLLAADHLLQAPEEVLCEIVHDDKLLHPDHLLKLAGRQWRFFRLGTRADLQSLGQSDRLEILPVSQIPLPACSRMPLPLAFRMTASLLAITKPGVRRVPLPAYPTRTFSIPKLFAHLPSLVLRSTGKPTEQAGRQQKEAGRKKWNPEWKKNGEVGQLIGGGWVNLLSAVTVTMQRRWRTGPRKEDRLGLDPLSTGIDEQVLGLGFFGPGWHQSPPEHGPLGLAHHR